MLSHSRGRFKYLSIYFIVISGGRERLQRRASRETQLLLSTHLSLFRRVSLSLSSVCKLRARRRYIRGRASARGGVDLAMQFQVWKTPRERANAEGCCAVAAAAAELIARRFKLNHSLAQPRRGEISLVIALALFRRVNLDSRALCSRPACSRARESTRGLVGLRAPRCRDENLIPVTLFPTHFLWGTKEIREKKRKNDVRSCVLKNCVPATFLLLRLRASHFFVKAQAKKQESVYGVPGKLGELNQQGENFSMQCIWKISDVLEYFPISKNGALQRKFD